MATTRSTSVTSLGNAGFLVRHGDHSVFLDPFFRDVRLRAGIEPPPGGPCLFLVTHDHWDHFSPERLAREAARLNAAVAGPRLVTDALRRAARGGSAPVEMEPEALGRSVKAQFAGVSVTAFRTAHGQGHNSYLVEIPGFRFFDDGDNEDTRCLDAGALGRLDALMICPWKGSGWAGFIEELHPARWFLMHMSDEELDQHERGEFFPGLCDSVPAGIVALRPGGTWTPAGEAP
jgi:L-ascorbate metabolism protein UlaG (beta-lactamase superfamily)